MPSFAMNKLIRSNPTTDDSREIMTKSTEIDYSTHDAYADFKVCTFLPDNGIPLAICTFTAMTKDQTPTPLGVSINDLKHDNMECVKLSHSAPPPGVKVNYICTVPQSGTSVERTITNEMMGSIDKHLPIVQKVSGVAKNVVGMANTAMNTMNSGVGAGFIDSQSLMNMVSPTD